MAEIEIGIMSRQCLGIYTATQEKMEQKVSAWCSRRNDEKTSNTPSAPTQPSEPNKTHSSITINTASGQKYICTTGNSAPVAKTTPDTVTAQVGSNGATVSDKGTSSITVSYTYPATNERYDGYQL